MDSKILCDIFAIAWEQRKVSDLAEKTYGGGTPTTSNEAYWNGDIPWIQSSDVVDGKLLGVEPRKWITQDGLNNSAAQLIPGNSIAIITRVGVGKLAFMPYSYATSQDFLSLSKLNEEPLFTVYACYKKLQSELNAVQGTSIKGITKDELLAKNIMVPRYAEQQQIGAFFKQLDNLITLHQRKLEHVKDLKKSMLQKMFPKNGQLYPEVRFPGFTDAWEQRKLGEVATFINGRAYSQDELLDEGKYKVLRVGNFYTNDSWYYSDLELPDKFYAQEGDLLYTWSATFGPHIWHGNKVIYHYHIWKVELSDKLDKTFTLQLLEEDKANILANKNGSTMVHITKEGMEQKQISIPSSVQEQAQIGAYFEQLDNLITLHQRELDHLQLLKKGMLQQMFV